MILWIIVLAAVAGSLALTGAVRRYALARAILDVPNHRSSHSVPMPRGGGLAIAIVSFSATMGAAAAGLVSWRLAAAALGGGAMIAAVGWLDDRYGVAATVRLGVHTVAAIWAVWLGGGMPAMRFGTTTVSFGSFGAVVATLFVVWLVNLYNFMDGIDGIAGSEAVIVGVVGGALAFLSGSRETGTLALIVAASALGFLGWNWPPAKIFMGDAGSCLLGYLIGVIALFSERSGGVPLVGWCILLGVFLVDATVTLLRRMVRGERWYAAHKSHAFQRMVQAGWTHRRCTTVTALVTVALGLLAALAIEVPVLAPAIAASAFLGLLVTYSLVERVRPMPHAAEAHAPEVRSVMQVQRRELVRRRRSA